MRIRRHHIVEDGFAKLGVLRDDLKGVVKVHFVNESGLDESGIDMGGLYKEFLTTLIERAFHPDYGLFKFSADRQLYPNPDSHVVHNHLDYFAFIGRILGKALFDGIQMDLPFCGFFVSKLLGALPLDAVRCACSARAPAALGSEGRCRSAKALGERSDVERSE